MSDKYGRNVCSFGKNLNSYTPYFFLNIPMLQTLTRCRLMYFARKVGNLIVLPNRMFAINCLLVS